MVSRRRWVARAFVALLVLLSLAVAVGSFAMRHQNDVSHSVMRSGVSSGAGGTLGAAEPTPLDEAVAAGVVPAMAPAVSAPMPSAPMPADGPVDAQTNSTLTTADQRIARSADMTVEVKAGAFERAWVDAIRIAGRFGGVVMGTDRTKSSDPIRGDAADPKAAPSSGDITIRIPVARFDSATVALRALGIVRSESMSSQDVSQEYVDLQSRRRNLRAEESALLRLMARANTVGETLSVQNRLSSVQGEIEQVTGRIRYLNAHTEFSTVTLHIAEPGALPALATSSRPTLTQAWDTALTGLVRIGAALMIFIVWVGPFALLGGLLFAWRRRAHRSLPAPVA